MRVFVLVRAHTLVSKEVTLEETGNRKQLDLKPRVPGPKGN
jgi:hypothetical protein